MATSRPLTNARAMSATSVASAPRINLATGLGRQDRPRSQAQQCLLEALDELTGLACTLIEKLSRVRAVTPQLQGHLQLGRNHVVQLGSDWGVLRGLGRSPHQCSVEDPGPEPPERVILVAHVLVDRRP